MPSSMAQYLPKRLPTGKYLYNRYPSSRHNSAVGRQGLEPSHLLIGARLAQRKGGNKGAGLFLGNEKTYVAVRFRLTWFGLCVK